MPKRENRFVHHVECAEQFSADMKENHPTLDFCVIVRDPSLPNGERNTAIMLNRGEGVTLKMLVMAAEALSRAGAIVS